MDVLLVLFAAITAVVAFDAFAASSGADSRDPMPDSHRR
jgi:hypothetical protein